MAIFNRVLRSGMRASGLRPAFGSLEARGKARASAYARVVLTGNIRDAADIAAVEAGGLEAFLPDATPYGILRAQAEVRPNAVALRYVTVVDEPDRDVSVTYRELVTRVRQAARLFRRLGVGPDDGIAILMPHVPSAHVALWGAEIAGRACPLNPLLREDHLVALLEAARVKVAVVAGVNHDLDIWSTALPALRKARCVTHVLHADADDVTAGSDGCFEDLLAAEDDDASGFDAREPDDVVASFHTGGTTGIPKLALHSARNEAFVARGTALMCALDQNDVVLNGFPLFHVAGAFVYGLSALFAGATIVVPTRLGMRTRAFVGSIWRQVERYGITVLGAVPTSVSTIAVLPVDADISTLRVLVTGGSPMPPELAAAFERNVGVPLRNVLGMTESSGIVTIEPFAGERTPGSTGLPLPFTLVDAFRANGGVVDLAVPCERHETGVLAVRGPNVSPGYGDPSRNPGTFDEGWLVSGDLGHLDDAGRVFVTGRAKDVIIRGGHNIDPAAIEEALLQHPDVAFAAAVGAPDAYAGEIPVAFVALHDGATTDSETLRAFVETRVPEPAAIPKYVEVVKELPLTPVGKVYKPRLRAIATKRAIVGVLDALGIPRTTYRLTVNETDVSIELQAWRHESRLRDALVGMPITYDIAARPERDFSR